MRRPGSLQGRLAWGLGLGLTLLWIATAWLTASLLHGEMDEVFDSALEETAQRILPLAVLDILDRDEEGISQQIATLREHEEFFTYLVRDDRGRVLLRSHQADLADFPPYDGTGFRQTATHRLYQDAALQGTVTIAVAEPLSHRAEVAREIQMVLALPLLVIVPIGLVGLALILRRSLRPLRRYGAALSTRGVGDFGPVPGDDLPDEIAPVAVAINDLLQRLGRTLDAERSFAANAAHELRTPVAAALAQVQRLIAETDDPATTRRATDIETALKRLNRLSEKLLQLARAEGARLRTGTVTDLGPVLRMVVADLDRDGDRVTLDLPADPVLSDLDADAFAILGRNLIENALRHGAKTAPVRVILTGDGRLRVVNDGPALAVETLAKLTARFERGGTTAEGSGLGLAIARTIAEGAGGSLSLQSPAPGQAGGFSAEVRVPVDPGKTSGRE